jgi:hypothetical protein
MAWPSPARGALATPSIVAACAQPAPPAPVEVDDPPVPVDVEAPPPEPVTSAEEQAVASAMTDATTNGVRVNAEGRAARAAQVSLPSLCSRGLPCFKVDARHHPA